MSKAAQLKKKASELEQKKLYDRALAMYVQAIDASAGIPEEIDIPLYNRVGDLHLRLGDLDQAVNYYEKAVDLYAEGGFFNNAIALCNKVLRHAPSRSSIYYKLGKISAKKGFNSDAKQNFLEYADRMQKGGKIDEAFRALKEFADLCPGQDDVRLMLAEQLGRVGQKEEALEQLQLVYDTMVAEERTTEAAATLERMRALDPTVEPKRASSPRQQQRGGLVFIDTNDEAPASVPHPESVSAVEGLESTSLASPDVGAISHEEPTGTLPDIEPTHLAAPEPLPEPKSVPEAEVIYEPPPAPAPARDEEEVVDLESWLREIEPERNPRMTAAEEPQAPGAVQSDFNQMLETFKRGVAQNVDESDSNAHYDLGVAYMEMGLLDEAISQFQTAIRGDATPEGRGRAYESLGRCFIERGEYDIALASLSGVINEPNASDDKLVGVLYLLGFASESLEQWRDAEMYYKRVLAVDINFRDTTARLKHVASHSAQGANA